MSRQQDPKRRQLKKISSRAVLVPSCIPGVFLMLCLLGHQGSFCHRIVSSSPCCNKATVAAFGSFSRINRSSLGYRRISTLIYLNSEMLEAKNTFKNQITATSQSNKIVNNKMDAADDDQNKKDSIGVKGQEKRSIKARIVSTDTLEECGERIRQGKLVAFPTETVYGLGCNALDESAITKVFEAKERPLTDPLISHVSNPIDAYRLWAAKADSLEGKALRILCDKFWPGPLTLVAKAASHVPSLLMANTGFVACRSPQHPLSVCLINAASVPVAAPSANKFGHVSPTRAQHVFDDLLYEDVWIINPVDENIDSDGTVDVCNVGVESSVAKIETISDTSSARGTITLLRQGAVSLRDIETCLDEFGLGDFFSVEARTKKTCTETVATVAPGQTIRHYAPDIPSYVVSFTRCASSSQKLDDDEISYLSKCVIIDFGSKLHSWKKHALAYVDLSENGDSSQATKSVFETLRWAERVGGAVRIIFPEIDENGSDALALALKDRLTRAASGVVVDSIKV